MKLTPVECVCPHSAGVTVAPVKDRGTVESARAPSTPFPELPRRLGAVISVDGTKLLPRTGAQESNVVASRKLQMG